MPLVGSLPDIKVPGAELQRPSHRLLLVVSASARKMEVHAVRPHRLRGALDETKAQLCVRTGQKDAARILDEITTENGGPELGHTSRIVCVEGHGVQSRKHAHTIDAGSASAARVPVGRR